MAADIKTFAFNPFTGSLDVTQDVANMVDGPATSTDNALVRYDGTTGKLVKDSSIVVDNSANASGFTSIAVGNLSLSGNALSVTDTDGDLDLSANGTGRITANSRFYVSQDAADALEVVTKQQLDAAISGVDVKEGVVVATTANITLSGEQTIDGVLTSASRVLVKNQNTPSENGIYVSAAGAWSRSTDADTGPKLENALVTVQQGTTQSNTGWYQTADSISIGVTNIVFVQFFGAGTYTADGNGIELTGSTFSLELDGVSLSKSSSGLRVAVDGVDGTMIRLANDQYLRGRNQAGGGDINIIKVNTSDTLTLGTSTIPSGDNTLDFGSTAFNFKDLHARTLNSNSTMAITSTSGLTVKTADSSSGASASASYITGDVSGSSTSGTGNLTSRSGAKSGTGIGATGNATYGSGNNTSTGNSDTGSVTITSGTKSGSGNGSTGTWTGGSGANSANTGDPTGAVVLESGAKSTGSGASGTIIIRTGGATLNTGAATLRSGNSSSGSSGNVSLISGTAPSGTRGDIILDGLKISASSTRITSVAEPTASSDAATRSYADMPSSNVNSSLTLTRNTISLVDTTAARALTLPTAANDVRLYIKDRTGSAEANNITITPPSGTIEGAASYIINSNYGSVFVICDGTNWFII